jgi:hypothetical protein
MQSIGRFSGDIILFSMAHTEWGEMAGHAAGKFPGNKGYRGDI